MPSKTPPGGHHAELALVPLKNCLVNLPPNLVSALVNANKVAQNVVVELTRDQSGAPPQSFYAGWTGMPSKPRIAPLVGNNARRGQKAAREPETSTVEMDMTFARSLGLTEGQKVSIELHVDTPLAHTVNIEPLTPADWEIMELHAKFLELNLLAQIRALPNPTFKPPSKFPHQPPHPLTVHLSPTATAGLTVTSLIPPPPDQSPFARIAPDAEVIVAPKTRQKASRHTTQEGWSIASGGQRSSDGKGSHARPRSSHEKHTRRPPIFLRGVNREIAGKWFGDAEEDRDEGLKVWMDRDVLATKTLRGTQWASVSVVRPAGLEESGPQQQQEQAAKAGKPAARLVARIEPWDDAPDARCIALSSLLCGCLGVESLVGGIIRVAAAPPPIVNPTVTTVKVFPFPLFNTTANETLRFGGESSAEREEAARRIQDMFGIGIKGNSLLHGPITDGIILPKTDNARSETSWNGGTVKFETPQSHSSDRRKGQPDWLMGSNHKIHIDVQTAIDKAPKLLRHWCPGEPLPYNVPLMVGIDPLIEQLMSNLTHSSSVLLTGGLGSGKTTLCRVLAHRLRRHFLFSATYLPCRTLMTEEIRVSKVKETLNRAFAAAAWAARLGGRAIVILDDLDRLCPVETELQGGSNERSRHVSELLGAVVRQHCSRDSGVVLLATAQSKDSLNGIIVGGHVVSDIINLKAPDKEGRRKILEALVDHDQAGCRLKSEDGLQKPNEHFDGAPEINDSSNRHAAADASSGVAAHPSIDLLDLAGQIDGYMPGDLALLVSRARNEAIIRFVPLGTPSTANPEITLSKEDFDRALKGFTPASLRNVTLQHSTTTFASIGGLHETRKTLLETLQYPTTYAPIFAQCPLRLRSGLLLYGYPGCGKTLLASAVAGECGLNFISVKGPEILNKYIGASEKAVRDLFDRAQSARPCILFFDEFDSIAPQRGHDSTGVTDRVVNQLLTQMDGAEGLSGVYVLAATSRPDLIDPALLRPGRLDKSLLCDLPSFEDRVDILRAVSGKLRLSENLLSDEANGPNLEEIARRTNGYSGADLQAVMYNAHLEAIHDLLGDSSNAMAFKNGTTTNGTTSTMELDGDPNSEYISFLFSAEEDAKAATAAANSGRSTAATLAERGVVRAKIDALRVSQREQRRPRLASSSSAGLNGRIGGVRRVSGQQVDRDPKTEKQSEPTITWRHILSSLSSTRSSISPEERRRLARIYREFVVGRSGEMPSGQGGNEIGARTSLM